MPFFMELVGEAGPPMPRKNTWYWFMALGFTALIITSGIALIQSQGESTDSTHANLLISFLFLFF
jgi:hypothetical protein